MESFDKETDIRVINKKPHIKKVVKQKSYYVYYTFINILEIIYVVLKPNQYFFLKRILNVYIHNDTSI